jgi:hypothetical protein
LIPSTLTTAEKTRLTTPSRHSLTPHPCLSKSSPRPVQNGPRTRYSEKA